MSNVTKKSARVPEPPTPSGKPEPKPAPKGRAYLADALASLNQGPSPSGTSIAQNRELLAAIILAQAMDRLGARVIEAAAVSQYKRT